MAMCSENTTGRGSTWRGMLRLSRAASTRLDSEHDIIIVCSGRSCMVLDLHINLILRRIFTEYWKTGKVDGHKAS